MDTRSFAASSPRDILDDMNIGLSETLRQASGETTVRDGMDIVLCRLHRNSGKLEFASANNPLYTIRNGKLTEIKGDKFPIGKYAGESFRNFTHQEVQLQPGDNVFIFSDGYADQFGGPEGKKFKYRQMKDLFLRICSLPPVEQKEILERTIEDWKGPLEQVDDICVIGVRV